MSNVARANRDLDTLRIKAGDYVLLLEDGTAEVVHPVNDPVALRVAREAGAFDLIPPSASSLPAAWRHVPLPLSPVRARLRALP